MDDRRARRRTPAACDGPVQEKRIRAGKCRNGVCGTGLPCGLTATRGTRRDRTARTTIDALRNQDRYWDCVSARPRATVARAISRWMSQRLMPVSASPSPQQRAPKPASSSASRRPRGRRSTSRSSRRARTRHATVPAPRHGGPPAPVAATDLLRQPRRHCAAPAGSDDARNAPAINGLTLAGASDGPK